MPNNVATRQIYESVRMVHPDGTVMCLTSERRANWFIERNLAVWEGDDHKAFRLTFTPGGKGKHDNPFYIQERENICVCCGSTEGLNRHHVFPTVFRKHLSTLCKAGNSHDVMPICHECHEDYEIEADKLKALILDEFGIQRDFKQTDEEKHNKQILQARAMLERLNGGTSFTYNGKVIAPPPEVIERFKEQAAKELINEHNTPFFVRSHWGKIVMDKIHSENKEQEFVQRWRQHFVDTMKPKFLPNHWSVDAKLEYIARARKDVVLNERDKQLNYINN